MMGVFYHKTLFHAMDFFHKSMEKTYSAEEDAEPKQKSFSISGVYGISLIYIVFLRKSAIFSWYRAVGGELCSPEEISHARSGN